MNSRAVTAKGYFFLAGLGAGAAVALIFAPKSGEQTREYIADGADRAKEYLAAKGRGLRHRAEGLVKKDKKIVA